MKLRIIAATSLVALAAQGCYRPMYAPPYGYSSQGYPIGTGYPGSIQTTTPGQPYVPMGTPAGGGSMPTYPPTYNPTTAPSASSVPVPNPRDAAQWVPPAETSGGHPLGFAPTGNGLIQTAGTAPIAQPNPFPSADAQALAQPTFAEPAPTTVTSDNFNGGNSPTKLQ